MTSPILVLLNVRAGNGHDVIELGSSTLFCELDETKTETDPPFRPIVLILLVIADMMLMVRFICSCLGSTTKIKSDGFSHGVFESSVPVGLLVLQ